MRKVWHPSRRMRSSSSDPPPATVFASESPSGSTECATEQEPRKSLQSLETLKQVLKHMISFRRLGQGKVGSPADAAFLGGMAVGDRLEI